MANTYYVKIKTNQITQEVASKIMAKVAERNLLYKFSFIDGYISYSSRGLTDIIDILTEYGINDEDIEVKDEFELVEKAL